MPSANTFELRFQQNDAGPGDTTYTFSNGRVTLEVQDVSNILNITAGHGAVMIHFLESNWLYTFDSSQYPPEEPRLYLSSADQLSIQGTGTLKLLQNGPMRDAVSDLQTDGLPPDCDPTPSA